MYPTLVQGPYAKDNIVENIKKVNKDKLTDVIILGRGGGSIEDLWPFNEEAVAYEIFKSKIPIISSVGHETDFTISDFVSDLRAPTPSGGAELAVPNKEDLYKYLSQIISQNELALKRLMKRKNDSLNNILTSYIFRDPLRLTEQKSRKLDHIMEKLDLLHPGNKLKQSSEEVLHKTKLLNNYFHRLLEKKQTDYLLKLNKLELVNPLSIMKKGYSLSKVNGTIIKTIKDVKVSDKVDILVNDGVIETTVINVREDK